MLEPGETWIYEASDPDADAGQYENTATVTGTATPGGVVSDSDASHYFGAEPEIDVEKSVNGDDADTAPGPLVTVGDPVDWEYTITNTGNVPLEWSLADDPDPGPIACPRLGILVPGKSVTCHASLAGGGQAGAHSNTATATGTVRGTGTPGVTTSDTDPANYFGVQGAIDVEKATNGVDADQPPGPAIAVGGAVAWTYVVTNEGNGPLTNIVVTDDRGVSVTCPQTALAAGDSMACTGAGIATADKYTNTATATGRTLTGERVSDEDPSNYFGTTPGVLIEKSTNGVDADDAPGVLIPVGQPVEWTYTVTNTGNNTLNDIDVSDDQGVTVTCPSTTLDVGEQMTCTASGTAAEGDYENTGTVTAVGSAGTPVTDDDPSHYYGVVSEIHVEKFTNGVDADTPTGPNIPVGAPVTWTYQVTNPGNVRITNVALVDDKGVTPSFVSGDANSDGELQPGEIWVYEAHGTATAGQYVNVATVTGLDQLEDPLTDSDPSHFISEAIPPPLPPPSTGTVPETGAQRPRLVLRKRAGSARVRAGRRVNYQLRVRNTGRGTANRVRVCDRLPRGLVFATTRGAQIKGRRACFTVRTLRPGRSRTFVVRARAESTERAHRICNTAIRSARGVRVRAVRACINVLPAFARRGGGVTG